MLVQDLVAFHLDHVSPKPCRSCVALGILPIMFFPERWSAIDPSPRMAGLPACISSQPSRVRHVARDEARPHPLRGFKGRRSKRDGEKTKNQRQGETAD